MTFLRDRKTVKDFVTGDGRLDYDCVITVSIPYLPYYDEIASLIGHREMGYQILKVDMGNRSGGYDGGITKDELTDRRSGVIPTIELKLT